MIRDIDPLVSMHDVCAMTRLSRATIYRRLEDGSFPPPKRIGGTTIRWPLSVVRQWIDDLPVG